MLSYSQIRIAPSIPSFNPKEKVIMTKIIKNLAVSFVLTFAGLSTANAAAPMDFVENVEVVGAKAFVVAEKFREGETTDGVSIHQLGNFFKSRFLSKTEMNVAKTTLRFYKLKRDSSDLIIRAQLGDTAEINLANFWELLKKQKTSRVVAYIRDTKGVFWTMYGYWDTTFDGWYVEALPPPVKVEDSHKWPAGYLIGSH